MYKCARCYSVKVNLRNYRYFIPPHMQMLRHCARCPGASAFPLNFYCLVSPRSGVMVSVFGRMVCCRASSFMLPASCFWGSTLGPVACSLRLAANLGSDILHLNLTLVLPRF